MDIFVRNIPDQASEKSLERFFRNQFRAFGIESFSCHKLKSRGCATITVLDADKAQKFLNVYGVSSQKDINQTGKKALKFMDRDLFCVPSKHKSNDILLQTLRKEAKENGNRMQRKTLAAESAEKIEREFGYVSVRCGLWDYHASSLVFISQFDEARRGSIMFGKKNLALVACSEGVSQESYRLDVPYSGVKSITIGSIEDSSVTLTLSESPRIYQDPPTYQTLLPDLSHGLGLQMSPSAKAKRRRVTSLGGAHESVVGTCFVYRIYIADPSKIHRIGLLLQKGWEMPASIPRPTPVFAPKSPFVIEMDRLRAALHHQCRLLDFGVQFQVQRLAQNGYLTATRVIDILPHILQVCFRSGCVVGAEVVRKLSRQLPYAGPEVDGEVFTAEHLKKLLSQDEEASVRELSHSSRAAQQNSHIVLVHKAIVTPAGVYLEGPEPETKNRVLRAYSEHADNFIRVIFFDEDWEPMRFDRFVSLENIYHSRFKKVLDGAIPIAGRRFVFLGFSHSSLKSHTCWFMAPFEQHGKILYPDAVIVELGNFSAIRSPARCAARIGQAFTNTDGAVKISPAAVGEISDVERNGRVFSDGVGTISARLLAKISKEYAPARKLKPTLYQIRFAGAKGMISLDTRLAGEALLLRQSMIKFTGSNASDIEICGSASRALPMFLNRQYIKIMEDLGVDPNVFMELQKDAVERLRKTTLSAANAANFLKRELVGKAAQVPWLIQKLYHIGFEFLEDSFLRGTVELAVLSQLRDLKHRSRIPVEQAVTLYGIMDETDTLGEGEIYCSTDNEVVIGRVAVTRAPAMHPGDIQVATAVDVADESPLNALHNCVVFSQRGWRDLPSQLAGGDLDGDIYSVIYDPRLLPPRVVEPADYPRAFPKDIGRPVTLKDMTDFFIDFMENDQLGRIANLHMQLADRREGGTEHSDCLTLAEMHSTAVDFSKTGVPVDMSRCPRYDSYRPDFMAPSPRVTVEKGIWALEEKSLQSTVEEDEDLVAALDPDTKSYRYYESTNILGKLFRAVDEKDFLAELQRRSRELEATDRFGQTLIHRLWAYVQRQTHLVQWNHYRAWAREIKEAYETELLNTIYQYSTHPVHLISELEVFVGTLLGKDGGARNWRLREMSMNMKEKFERDVAFTVNCITKGPRDDEKYEALERSVACLAVAVEELEDTGERVKKLESFRYVAAAVCLGEVERFHKGLNLQFPL